MKKLLVLGGAGYIGSHTVHELVEKGYDVVVADNLEKGHRAAVHPKAAFREGDIRDAAFMDALFGEFEVDCVVHFAAYSLVGESVGDPLKYYDNNVGGTRAALSAMAKHGVKNIVFSSSAAVYGEPESVPIPEEAALRPESPYGASKLTMEQMMAWCERAYKMKYVSLRYFNACGALPGGKIGEDHAPETHLIPNVLRAALGKAPALEIYGNDYPTRDGTCVRDYIHVCDLARAHVLAAEHLMGGGDSGIFNLGSGEGFTVKEILHAAEEVVGGPIPHRYVGRRAGDPAKLVASNGKASRALGFTPEITSIRDMIASAWAWHGAHPQGFADYTPDW
ncbi:MAG TPA: UDP-glucose 4-epimerase GalE [Clostridia bacterium]|nr:UDP-glucose 4-epimerase GalE [Clostridia bacterium]